MTVAGSIPGARVEPCRAGTCTLERHVIIIRLQRDIVESKTDSLGAKKV